jgi:tRNA (guanine37-N1)-methyltransferase
MIIAQTVGVGAGAGSDTCCDRDYWGEKIEAKGVKGGASGCIYGPFAEAMAQPGSIEVQYLQPMKIQIISLFPEMFPPVLETSMLFKAKDKGLVEYSYINLRDFGLGPRKTVDDTPYGGGDGMLLKPEPLFAAVEHAKKQDSTAIVYLMTPRGKRLVQKQAQQIADQGQGMIIICARYEGYDERITTVVDKQISIGDFVLTGGELPAMMLVDAVVRLIPGVLGGEKSAEIESFSHGTNLEFPQYTRPEDFRGMKVPDVLLSGNHAHIEKWRQQQSKLQCKD